MKTERQMLMEANRLAWQMAHHHASNEQKALAYGAALALEWACGKEAAQPSRQFRAELLRRLERLQIPHCVMCGCTEDFACVGGCSWSEESLCTGCTR